MFAQHHSKRSCISSDDRFHGRLELAHRPVMSDNFGKCSEICPRLKAILPGDDSLRITQLQRGGSDIRYGLATKSRVQPFEAPFGFFIARFHPLEQRFRLLLILLKAGVEWERLRVVHFYYGYHKVSKDSMGI